MRICDSMRIYVFMSENWKLATARLGSFKNKISSRKQSRVVVYMFVLFESTFGQGPFISFQKIEELEAFTLYFTSLTINSALNSLYITWLIRLLMFHHTWVFSIPLFRIHLSGVFVCCFKPQHLTIPREQREKYPRGLGPWHLHCFNVKLITWTNTKYWIYCHHTSPLWAASVANVTDLNDK